MFVFVEKMILLLVLATVVTGIATVEKDPAANQIVDFKEKTSGSIALLTTTAGAPVEYSEATITLNKRLIFNEYFMDSLTHIVRERIPERVVHAKAGGAFGYFEVTHDISDICKAKVFGKVGKKTPIAVRFSPAVADKGSIETSRDARGFAVKFYTEDGNFDIAGLNTPMFVYKDPLLFATFAHSQKRNPATNLLDPNMFWDFLTLQPESLHMFLLIFGDRGIPDGYRHMPGFGIHTFQVVNHEGEKHFIRFHFRPDAGIKNLRSEEARQIAGVDPDYATRDLYKAIGNGDFPSWTASIQVLTSSDVIHAGFDVFDVTRVLPLDKYPLRPLGRLVLNRNAANYFAEIEQLAFNPANLVPGILGGPDKVFEARRLVYRDAQNYRLGANFMNIPVNCPMQTRAFHYNRDGLPPVKDNQHDIPNYYPNSFSGPVPYKDNEKVELVEIYQDQPNNFEQARDLYLNEMTPEERTRLVENILYSLGSVTRFLQDRAVKMFRLIHPDSAQIQKGLQANFNTSHTHGNSYGWDHNKIPVTPSNGYF